MSIAGDRLDSDAFARNDTVPSLRWITSFVAVLAAHAGLLLFLITHPILIEPPGAPPAAVLIQLAPPPAPAAPAPSPPEPPPPAPQPAPPEPVTPVPRSETPLPPEPVAPPKAITLPKPPPPRPPKPRPIIRRPPEPAPPPMATRPTEPRPIAPPAPATPPPAAPIAPATPQPSPTAIAGARANWQAQLVGWLARYKHYPRVAQEQRQEGVVSLAFTMDRSGRVLASRIARSSGSSLLDDEAMALIQRAQPLPALPAEVPGGTVQLVVPIAFTLH